MRPTSSRSFVGVQTCDECPGEQQGKENEIDLLIVLHADDEDEFSYESVEVETD